MVTAPNMPLFTRGGGAVTQFNLQALETSSWSDEFVIFESTDDLLSPTLPESEWVSFFK
jgi:hypothetical protein